MIHVENIIVTPSALPLTVGSRFLGAYAEVSPHDADWNCQDMCSQKFPKI